MRSVDPVLAALADNGLLLKQDKVLPNVVSVLTGESLSTSWWSHPQAHLIFSVLSELAEHPDVLLTKLLYRKDTLVHKSLWPAVLAVGRSRDEWQLQGLSDDAQSLLDRLEGAGTIRAVGAPVKELEARLLVTTQEIHTESGRHEMALESWRSWAQRTECTLPRSVPLSRKVLEDAAVKLGAPLKSLPWTAKSGT